MGKIKRYKNSLNYFKVYNYACQALKKKKIQLSYYLVIINYTKVRPDRMIY